MIKKRVLLICFLLISLCSCAPALVNFQGVARPAAKDCPTLTPKPICQTVTCPALDIPSRVPDNVVIEIADGKIVTLNTGGEELLRNYMATRKAISESWKK